MKKTILSGAIVATLLFFSCQNENSQGNTSVVSKTEQENWQTAKLDAKFADSQKQVTGYLFPTDEMSKLVETPNVVNVQFVLGYSDNTLQIKVIGVDKSGNELAGVDSQILKEASYTDKLAVLNVSKSKANKGVELLDKHLLFPKEAFDGITAWQEKLNSVTGLDEVLSYEGKRFKHYSLEKEIITDLLKNNNTTNVGLFLGLNPVGKVTTILIGLDKNNSIKKASLTAKDVASPDDTYDGARPSPPF
ncbi:hypothetical protein SAMN05444397_103512 [Flavobacterium aquidurense]|uniref:Lipoprotein n=1 Tax=Flavobacterium frigidimaris TaxID=262320 RepID=A0ABX4BN82_FLAFR|nr:hypothetical protein [Flavobacterium frigidimaris]OXA77353.1 hypothetical protein B0A65_17025 [Flavobacterium frigidimaris]SDZ12188.1 hypothetical protein SAMN05444397_103512 [Flavobacterium aquidurense]